ncbi:MAG: hypothetical protein SFW67_36415 [Myxococcaceae bacterium]|nr:hypothetical protein [Myxococcaceae bacterium]
MTRVVAAVLAVVAVGCRPFDEALDAGLKQLEANQAGGGAGGSAGGTSGGASGGSSGGTAGGSSGGAAGGSAGGASGGSAGGNSGGAGGGAADGGADGGSPDGGSGGCAPAPCVEEAWTQFGRLTAFRALATTPDGGVVAVLNQDPSPARVWRRTDGGWDDREVAFPASGPSNRTDARRVAAWSFDVIALADSSGPNMNLENGSSETSTCGPGSSVFSAAMPSPDEAWFGSTRATVCSWRRNGGFSDLNLTHIIGGAGMREPIFNGVWVAPDGRRFFAGTFQTLIAELGGDGGWLVSPQTATQSNPGYVAMRGQGLEVAAVGTSGIWARWSETTSTWVTGVTNSTHSLRDVWLDDMGVPWVVGQTGSQGPSFVGRLGDAGVVTIPLGLADSVQLLGLTGTRTELYLGGQDLDGGRAVLYRLRR